MDTAERYRRFGAVEVRGHSPSYSRLAAGIAADTALPALIDRLPPAKRQPNLLLGAVRYLGGPVGDFAAFRAWVQASWDRIEQTMLERSTQTNEPGRCATLLPLLASLPQPLALIEVGASAGLCLYPDRYGYRYDAGAVLGPADPPVVLDCRTNGSAPLPEQLPTVVWRAGIDLNPLDVSSADDVRWLESLVWPEQEVRSQRLRDAIRVAQAEPLYLLRGDLNRTVADLVARAPEVATPVVFHSAVLAYLSAGERESFVATMRSLPCEWISNEDPGVLPSVAARLPRAAPQDHDVFVLACNGRPVAFSGPHGQSLEWF